MQKQQTLFFTLFLLLTAQIGLSQGFIKDKSQVTFKIKNAGFWVNGSFSDFDMRSQFHPQALESSQVSGTLSVKSIATNNNKRDEHLRSEDYFEAEKFPEITLTSTLLSKQGDGYIWKGKLKIKETEKFFF